MADTDTYAEVKKIIVDLLSADYTFVNERLARHYGIPGVYGTRFRRVELDEVREGLRARMQDVAQLEVPLIVDVGVGDNWDEAH
jgi:hypothetical protein